MMPDQPLADKPTRVGFLETATSGAVLVSLFSLVIMLVALVVCYFSPDKIMLTVLIGVIAANSTQVVNYWVGSSAGSARKDVTISAQLPPTPTQPNPPAPPPLVP